MRQSGWILTGFCMLVMMLALVFFTAAIYDAEKKYRVETYFFESNTRSEQRVTAPVSADDIPQSVLREKIVEHFLHDYFYVIPDTNDAHMRVDGFKNTDNSFNAVWGMRANLDMPKKWQKNVGQEILDLASHNAMRSVQLVGDITESESGHLVVKYKLKTWNKPNDVMAKPTETVGNLYLEVTKAPIRVEQTEDVLERLKKGWDPVSAFERFKIIDVIQN